MLNLEKIVSRPRICYEIPLSKVVQSLKQNSKVETSWDVAKKFLQSCTTTRIACPIRLVLTINKHNERDTSHLESEVTKLFDVPETHFDGLYEQLKWKLEATQLAPAIDLMIQLQPYPPATRPCISLRIDYEFEFVNVETKENLENQEDKSHLAIFLEKNSHVMAEFWFPFSTVKDLSDYLSTIETLLPFKKLDKKAFRLIEPNKHKTRNVIRKISMD
jgi:hypothetical protein